jgi:hypothetical protein
MLSSVEIGGHKIKLIAAALALFGVAAVIMGSSAPSATSPALRGEWRVYVDPAPTACEGSGRRRFSLTVEADSIVVTKVGAVDGEGLRAVAKGNELRFDVRYTNAAGVETLESIVLGFQDGVMTGTSSFTRVRADETCSAIAPAFATR